MSFLGSMFLLIHVVEDSKQVLTMYNKDTMPIVGKCKLHLKNVKNGKKYLVPFVVVDSDSIRPLLGSTTAQQMKLIEVRYENIQQVQADEVENIVDEYKDVFTGLGSMPGKVHLTVDPEVKPVVMPPRKVPLAVKPLLKEELDRLENLEVIEKLKVQVIGCLV